jgi:hypothetical protein
MMDIKAIARALGGDVSGQSARVPGPGHSKADRSLSITLADNADGFICHSFAGDDPIECKDFIRARLGLPAFRPNGHTKTERPEVDISFPLIGIDWLAQFQKKAAKQQQQSYNQQWIYKTDDGTPYLRVERIQRNGGKIYPQYHWNGSTWEKGKPTGPKLPYRLPELVNAPGQPVFICEGEKCADAVAKLGWLATSASEGAGKWKPELNKWFADRVVYIVPDNDKPGFAHADMVARNLHGVAREVRVVKLEGLGDGEDVFDWIKREPFSENLLRIAEEAPLFNPTDEPIVPPSSENADEAVSLDDFYAYMLGGYIYLPTGDIWPAASVNARLASVGKLSAAAWLASNKAVEQITWLPGEPQIVVDKLIVTGGVIARKGVRIFNQYLPPTLKYGNPEMAGPWLDHVRKVYPDDADHLIRWLAHRVQRPQEKINHALVLGGKQGIGKDTLIEPVKRAVGSWNFCEVSPQQMLSRFNGFLKSVILRISEARDLGEFDRYKFYDHSKAYITAPPDTLRIDEKHIHEYSIPNLCGIIITTNHKTDGIYLPADDRRHYVAWSELAKDDFKPEYWTQLWRWYDSGGDGHVAAYLAGLDLSGFDPKAPPPKTQAFWEIIDSSRAPEDAETQDAIDHLGEPNPDALTINQLRRSPSSESFADYLRDRKNSRRIPHRLESCGYTAVRNAAAKDGLWKMPGGRQVIYAKTDLSLRDRIIAAERLCIEEGGRR